MSPYRTLLWTAAFVCTTANSFAASGPKELKRTESKPVQAEDIGATIRELQTRIAEQQKQIEKLVMEMQRQRELLAGIVETKSSSEPGSADRRPASLGGVARAAAIIRAASSSPMAIAAAPKTILQETNPAEDVSPLQFKIGSSTIMPVGFMDFTSVMRSTNPGTGIGTNFGSIPASNTVQGNLSETRLSAQNSRVGIRVDSKAANTNVLGYLEADFLGANPGNVSVTSNSSSLRMRLYWVDLKKGKYEVFGGQSWSMLTPNRKGLSALPGDLFYSQNIDVNYQLGLTWSRNPQFRFIYHPNAKLAMGLSLEHPEQYIGGSGGGGLVALPLALAGAYATQLNNGNTTLSVPALHPDIVAKIAYDGKIGSRDLHLELAGLERTFKVYNPNNDKHYTASGFGGSLNLNVELVKNFRLVSNNFWSNGGGRELFGVAPDLMIRGDGSVSPIHASSTVSGVELTAGKSQYAVYYGGAYIARNSAIDPANGRLVGYGYDGAPASHNRAIQEVTFDVNRTFWKDPKIGALNFMVQYSYLIRSPWYAAPRQPKDTSVNMVFLNLRYTLPGSAPTIK